MPKKLERQEREERAERLVWSRKNAGFSGAVAACQKFKWNQNNYKAHEAGRNGFGIADAKKYAQAFGVSLNWLNFGVGKPEDDDIEEGRDIIDIPLISWVSAGDMLREDIADEMLKSLAFCGLPEGDWIALRVSGDSMDLISPPDSIILVNRKDKRLVPNGLYVIADQEGNTTYKRYRPGPPPQFEPVSVNKKHKPLVPDQEATIVGRVRRSMIDT
jgi:SOS-response transcriptional repressor LexA